MSTINIEIEVPSSMPWSKKDFIDMVKAYAKALVNVKLKETKKEETEYENFVMRTLSQQKKCAMTLKNSEQNIKLVK